MSKIIFNHYILVANDSERDGLLRYYESKDIRWRSGHEATKINNELPTIYPYGIVYGHYHNNSEGKLSYNTSVGGLDNKIYYSEFLKRKDSPYTFYRHIHHPDILLLVHYKGSGIEFPSKSNPNIRLYNINIWLEFNVNKFNPIFESVKIKTIGMKKSTDSILFNTNTPRPIKLDSKGVYAISYRDFGGYEDIEHITI